MAKIVMLIVLRGFGDTGRFLPHWKVVRFGERIPDEMDGESRLTRSRFEKHLKRGVEVADKLFVGCHAGWVASWKVVLTR